MYIQITLKQFLVILLINLGLITAITIYYSYKTQKNIEKKYEKRKEDLKNELEQSIKKEYQAKLQKWKNKEEKKIRNDAVNRSNFVLKGKVAEKFTPLLKEFNHDVKNTKFLGDPIDYIAFDITETNPKIYFIEIKTGKSSLNKTQKTIKKAIKKNNVYWETHRIQ
ncbi:MAG: Secreted endonuclease, Holliday junction resolvase family [Candidatus Methanohalarchaeum thermophilum]|uniref:Secreted endonuclease, Holliday junction resolvase family n=1 Tax=Methanohalarchaeum thermophilum TaxID=1903181 RepID=A0A1Q6DU34_METT1|nr:MAG: Secreted endonuclease, Holliday junction resolvase family [Candidatus Methanohalarchaeum thermophilum]